MVSKGPTGHMRTGDLAILVDLHVLGGEKFFTMQFLNYHLRYKIVMWIIKHFSCRLHEVVGVVWVVI